MQNRWKLLALLILTAMSVSGQTSKPNYLPKADHVCQARLGRVFMAKRSVVRKFVRGRAAGQLQSGSSFL